MEVLVLEAGETGPDARRPTQRILSGLVPAAGRREKDNAADGPVLPADYPPR